MEIRLIATDMDGTFLADDKKAPPENIEALEECAARGIEIVPATGRTVRGIPDEIRSLPGVRYAITTNGAVVVDLKEDRILSTCRLSAELAVRIMTMARDSADDIMYDAYVEGVGCTTDYFYQNMERYISSPEVRALVQKTRQPVPDNIACVRDRGRDVDKINLFFRSEEARQRMRAALRGVPGILVTSSISNNLEINAEGADKGGALLRLAEYLGIRVCETMAFGDGENDLSMIKSAGIGVAMKNGEKIVREAADYVTGTNNEAGVAGAIRKLVLRTDMSAAADV